MKLASNLIPPSPQKGNRQGRKERQELMEPFEEVPVNHVDLRSVIEILRFQIPLGFPFAFLALLAVQTNGNLTES